MPTLKTAFSLLGVAALGVGATAAIESSAKADDQCSSTIVTAQAPSFHDESNSFEGDTVTIPASNCVSYTINDIAVPAGTHKVADYATYAQTATSNGWTKAEATVTAQGTNGHVVSGYYWWRQGFIGVYERQVQPTPAPTTAPTSTPTTTPTATPTTTPTTAPALKEVEATAPSPVSGGKLRIPNIEGVQYYVNDNPVNSGMLFDISDGTTAYVTFSAKSGYTLTNPDASWTFNYNPEEDAFEGVNEPIAALPSVVKVVAPTQEGSKLSIPSVPGIQYLVNGQTVRSGSTIDLTDKGTVKVTVKPASSHANLDNPNASWTFSYTAPAAEKKVVSFVAPTFDRTKNQYVIPNVEGLQYSVSGKNVAPGTYDVTGWNNSGKATVSVTARPKAGYVSDSGYTAYTWNASFTRTVTAAAPTFNVSGKQETDTFTIPSTTGVDYYANGKKVAAGTYKVKDYAAYTVTSTVGTTKISTASVTVEARSAQGYQVTGTYKWTQQFVSSSGASVTIIGGDDAQTLTQVTPKAPTFKAGWQFWFIKVPSKYTIPKTTGVDYYVNGQKVNAGTYQIPSGSSVTIKAMPQNGYTFPYNTVTINQWTYSSF